MFELMKIVGVSAVLSAGVVTATEMHGSAGKEPASAKIYHDRIPQGEPAAPRIMHAVIGSADERPRGLTAVDTKGDRLGRAFEGTCTAQAWPNISPDCLVAADGTPARSSVRTITVEQRQGPNTSVLVRIPSPEIAQR